MNRLYDTLAAAAATLMPAAMMAALGWQTYVWVEDVTGARWLAALSGIATAGAIETVGIVAGEVALRLLARHDRRWLIPAAVLLAYVATGTFALLGSPLVLLPTLAGSVYVLVGLRAQLEREDAASSQQADRSSDQQLQLALSKLQADKEVRIARLQAASSKTASGPAEPASNGQQPAYACKECGRQFSTPQALGGHARSAHKENANDA